MDRAFRFLHASDLQLERTVGGLAEVPDHLRPALADAAYRAAERVFDAALKHQVDFVVLAGGVVDLRRAPPRAIVFLNEQFQRLAEQGIAVYWAGSRGDDFERWADLWPLPENVHRFLPRRVERIVHHRAGEPLAEILGTSAAGRAPSPSDFLVEEGARFIVAVAHLATDAASVAATPIGYWALGGKSDRATLTSGTVTAHYCGTPQGRGPDDAGPRGCTLVHVADDNRVRTTFVPTDAVRYCQEQIAVDEGTTCEQLFEILNQRAGELLVDPFGPELLVRWTIAGSQSLAAGLRTGKLSGDLTTRLRVERGSSRPAAWTVAIEADASAGVPEELYDEETLLGEFLRSVRHYDQNADDPIDLASFLAERHLAGTLGALAALDHPDVRARTLAEAAALGVELLSPGERRS